MAKFKVKTRDSKPFLINVGIITVAIFLLLSIALLIIQICIKNEQIKNTLTIIVGSFESLGVTTTILIAIIQF